MHFDRLLPYPYAVQNSETRTTARQLVFYPFLKLTGGLYATQ